MATLESAKVYVSILICFVVIVSAYTITFQGDIAKIYKSSVSEVFVPVQNENNFDMNSTGGEDIAPRKTQVRIGLGCAITTREIRPSEVLRKLPIFTTLLPSFCQTASPGYAYHFYLSYDSTDRYFKVRYSDGFRNMFFNTVRRYCSLSLFVHLHFVRCLYAGAPARAQNDAMMAAYNDSMDYYYRINDDTEMVTKSWTETFISTLSEFRPPNVGVVGPNHRGGNTHILNYDFVHRTHIDIFGFYYPPVFTDWFADNWITDVYKPNRSKKMSNVSVLHTMSLGTRYKVRSWIVDKLNEQLITDKQRLKSWLRTLHDVK